MSIIDRTPIERSFAIIDMIRELPDIIGFAAINELPMAAQDDLYDFLKEAEDRRA